MKRIGVISTALLFTAFGFTTLSHAQEQKEAPPEKHQEEAKPEKQPKQAEKPAKPERQEARPQEQHHDQDNAAKDERKQQDQQRKEQDKASKDQQKAAKDQQKQEQKAQEQNQRQERDQQKAAQHDQQKDEDQRRNDQRGNDQRGNDQRGNDQRQNDQQRVQQSSRPAQPAQRANAREQRGAFQEHRARNWQSEHRTWTQRGGYHGYRIPDDRFRASFGESHHFHISSFPVTVVDGFPRFEINGFWFALVDPWPENWSDDWYDNDDCYVTYDDGGYYLEDVRYPGIRLAINVFVG